LWTATASGTRGGYRRYGLAKTKARILPLATARPIPECAERCVQGGEIREATSTPQKVDAEAKGLNGEGEIQS